MFDSAVFDSAIFDVSASVSASASAATGVGSASGASVSLQASAGVGAGSGAASAASATVLASAAAATGSGSAANAAPTGSNATSATAQAATGTGAAGGASASVAVSAGTGPGTGSAFNATATAVNQALAELASGTGSAASSSTAVQGSGVLSTGSGAALAPTTKVFASAQGAAGTGVALAWVGLAAGTGSASNPTVATVTVASAGFASGTGTAHQANVATQVRVALAGVATGTGAAFGPTFSVASRQNVASGSGIARNAAVVPTWIAGVAAGIGSAYSVSLRYRAGAETATGIGSGFNASTGSSGVAAAIASGTGSAIDATPNPSPAGLASGTGSALDATTSSPITSAGVATGTGRAYDHAYQLRTSPETSMTLTDPVGRVTLTTDITDFVWDPTSIGNSWDGAKTGWLKLVLTYTQKIRIDTFNSSLQYGGSLYLVPDPPDDNSTWLYYNSGISSGDQYSNYEAIPNTLGMVTLDAGTYWIIFYTYGPGLTTLSVTGGDGTPYIYFPPNDYDYYGYPSYAVGYALDARVVIPGFVTPRFPSGTGTARKPTVGLFMWPPSASGTGGALNATASSPGIAVFAGVATGTGMATVVSRPALVESFFGDTTPISGVIYDPVGVTYVTVNPSTFTQTDPPVTPAAPVVVNETSGIGYGNSFSIPKFADQALGDLLLLSVSFDTVPLLTHTNPTTTAFSNLLLNNPPNGDGSLQTFSKVVWDDEPSVYTFAFSYSIYYAYKLLLIRSVSGQVGFGSYAGQSANTSPLAHPINVNAATTRDNTLLLVVTAGTNAGSWTVPSGMTLAGAQTGYIYADIAVFKQTIPASGTTPGIKSTTHTNISADLMQYVMVLPPPPLVEGYTGWVKLVLPSTSLITIDTFGSGVLDTKLAIFADPPPADGQTGALYSNDDTTVQPFASTAGQQYWSSIGPITLPAGTYWIKVWPYDGPSWNTAEGTITVNVTRFDGPSLEVVPIAGSPIRVILEHLGNISPIVVWAQSSLETALGPNGSLGRLVIKDLGSTTREFLTGQRVLVDLGPGTRPIYAGYVWRATRRFWFSVDDPYTMHRQWILTVVDIAALFSRRVVYKKASPATVKGPKYYPVTYDNTALNELTSNWLDLSTDDIDVTSQVHRVAPITYGGEPVYPFNGGQTWGEAMTTIAQLPAAAFGLNPSRQLVYADVDQRNVAFYLSDQPGSNNVGYREMLILIDGSQLVTEVYAWGAGNGSDKMVLSHRIDNTAVALHGLWQEGISSFSIWKQATINKVSDTVLNGSPTSHRGHKYDRVEIRAVTYEHGLVIGDRVRFISNIWSYDDVIPLRKVRMTFPTPYDVRYELTLSHEIDAWGFEDPPPPFPGVPPVDIPAIRIGTPNNCITAVFSDLPGGTNANNLSAQASPAAGPFATFDYYNRPFPSTTRPWLTRISRALNFPGLSANGGDRNQVTPADIATSSLITVNITALDGHGMGLNTMGILHAGGGGDSYVGAHTGVTEFNAGAFPSDLTDFYFYIYFGTYNPNLTGTGTISYAPNRFGTSLDWWTFVSGIGTLSITNNAYGSKLSNTNGLTYYGEAPWNRDSATGFFRFKVNRVSNSPAFDVRFLFGAAEVRISPSDVSPTPVTLITGSGGTSQNMSEAFIADAWYVLTISLDLPSNNTRARLWREATPGSVTEVTQAANFERVGVGSYRPEMGWWITNPTALPVVLSVDFNALRTESYETATPSAASIGVYGTNSTSGWGSPWITYGATATNDISPGVDPNLTYSSDGTTGRVVITTGQQPRGWIQRDLSAGGTSLDIAFSWRSVGAGSPNFFFSKYRSATNRYNYFGASVIIESNAINMYLPDRSFKALYDSVNPSWGSSTTNTRVRISGGGMQVKIWLSTEVEPVPWTYEFLKTITLTPDTWIWGIQADDGGDLGAAGNYLQVGPLAGVSGSSSLSNVFFLNGDVNQVDTGILTLTTPVLGGWSPASDWYFAYPNDGREYAISWPPADGQTYTVFSGAPVYTASMVWSLFDDGGPGAPTGVSQHALGVNIPAYGGVAVNHAAYKVIVRGEVGGRITNFGPFGGGPLPSSLTEYPVSIRVKGFTQGSTGTGLPTSSPYTVFGWDRTTVESTATYYGTPVYQPFEAEFTEANGLHINSNGTSHLSWGLYMDGTDGKNLIEILHAMGLYLGGFFFYNNSNIGTVLRNVTYEVYYTPLIVLTGKLDPCPPNVQIIDTLGAGGTSGGVATGSSTVLTTPEPYLPNTLRVWKNGHILRWGIDFTETVPSTGTFTMTSPVLSTDVITTFYNTELTA